MLANQNEFQKHIAQAAAPMISRAILFVGATDLVRKFITLLNYFIGRGAGMGWALSSEVAVALNCIKRKNPVVFDVGANVGEWSQKYRKLQPNGILYMFDPQVACQKAIVDKQIPNAELVKVAVGRQKGKLKLYSSHPADATASFHERRDSFFQGISYAADEVDVIQLDQFISERNISFIDYIKFDIEGHELEALAGLQSALTTGKIGAFSFEFGSGNINSRTCFRDFWDLLSPSYLIFIITPSGKLVAIDEYYEDMEFYRGVSNFVAQLKKQRPIGQTL